MKTLLSLGIITLLVMSMVSAQLSPEVMGELEGQQLPGPLGTLFGNSRINFHIGMADDTENIVGLIIENKFVTQFELTAIEDPDLRIMTDEVTLAEILNSVNPLLALQKAISEERVTYEAIGFFNKIKYGFIGVFVNLDVNEIIEQLEPQQSEDIEVVIEDIEPEDEISGGSVADPVAEESEEIAEEDESTKVHTVNIGDEGFEPEDLSIAVGDTVEWKNTRTKNPKKVLIVGARACKGILSDIFKKEETFSHTFTEAETCTIVEGASEVYTMKIIIE